MNSLQKRVASAFLRIPIYRQDANPIYLQLIVIPAATKQSIAIRTTSDRHFGTIHIFLQVLQANKKSYDKQVEDNTKKKRCEGLKLPLPAVPYRIGGALAAFQRPFPGDAAIQQPFVDTMYGNTGS